MYPLVKYEKSKHKCGKKCKCCCPKRSNYTYVACINRLYRDKSNVMRAGLGQIQFKPCPFGLKKFTEQDLLYQQYGYNASFHKTLEHSTDSGELIAKDQYEKLACAMFESDMRLLASVEQAAGAEYGFVNPTAAFSTILEGAPQCTLPLHPPSTMSSSETAAQMVEVYAQAVARDVSFIDYATDGVIATLLSDTHLNAPNIINNLPDVPPTPFTAQTVFRADADGCTIGPYISQLFLLPVPTSATTSFVQQYTTYLPRFASRVEWGISAAEMISIQNGTLPGPAPALDTPKYIYNGRTLAEAVHNDGIFQYYYQAAFILLGLGAPVNPDFPSFGNQDPFVTGPGLVNILTAVANVAKLALKHAWYWKWVRYRRLRPEVLSLWTHNVLSGALPNSPNYNLSSNLLTNPIVTTEIPLINTGWGSPGTYTLPLCYQEGSPAHPSYPAGHSVAAGACCTILKMFFQNDVDWTSLSPVVEPDTAGTTLVAFVGSTAGMTVGTEINKIGANVFMGRDWAGVHYRDDGSKGFELGERIAMKYMGDILSVSAENNLPENTPPSINFRKFNGELATVVPTSCSR